LSERTEPVAFRGSRIALLPDRVRDQIAAGEVIERPASVVKELVENALDAGAVRISVDLEEGGAKLVRVADDGAGMPREDLELAWVAHATSKLFDVGDLEHIASLGFRGEALASMGAVARGSIFSRERGAELGWRVEDLGGAVGRAVEAGGPAGTIVEIRDLFFNVPARRRFLRRGSTELARCLDVLQRVALARDGVGIAATHDGRRLYDVEPAMDLRARARRTFGSELADALVAVEEGSADLRLDGFVAPPRFARSDASRQMWFLNGRPVRDRVLLRALKEGYRGRLFEGRQPVAFLRLSMDPARVDVNVHPTKSEVRFRDERAVFPFLVEALRKAVARTDMATPGARLVEKALAREAVLEFPPRGEAYVRPALPPRDASVLREVPARPAPPVPGRFLQIARTYIVRETEGGFEIVDQHALHERVTFESLLRDLRANRVEVQRLLVPEIVEASPAEVELLAGRSGALAPIGIEIEPFGPTSVAVRGLPARLARPRAEAIVRDTIAVLEGARTGEREPLAEEILEEVLHRAACRSSVMAGDVLSDEEMRSLLERGSRLESDQTCVHGRPTRVKFSLADLERAFQRR
jgi:DNA mismatch repair protein MutL